MKTTFSRQFALIAALLLVCMIFTGVSFRFLMLGYLKNDKKETLSADAAAVASLAEAYDSTGELEENWDFRLSLSLFPTSAKLRRWSAMKMASSSCAPATSLTVNISASRSMRISSPKLTPAAKRSASGRWPASTTDGDTSRAGPLSPMIRTRRSAMSSSPPT